MTSTQNEIKIASESEGFAILDKNNASVYNFRMFPSNAQTYFGEFTASTTSIFEDANEFTILNISSTVSNTNSPLFIKCGNQTVFSQRAVGNKDAFVSIECGQPLVFQKTGGNIGSVNVTYVPFFASEATSTSEIGYNPLVLSDSATTSDVAIYGSISAGEFLIASILILGIFIALLNLLARSLAGVVTHRKIMAYERAEVPIIKD